MLRSELSSSNFSPPRTTGFTLVEMLLVVALIVLLISMLIPALNRSRELTMRTTCATRLAQCGGAHMAYAIDNTGQLLAVTDNSPGQDAAKFYGKNEFDLREIMAPWVSGFSVWNCPALNAPPIDDPANTRALCYGGYKYWALDRDGLPDFGTGRPLPRTLRNSPATLPLMQDRFDDRTTQASIGGWFVNHAERYSVSDWGRTNGNPSITNRVAPSMADGGGANIVFIDGSTRWFNVSDLVFVGDDTNVGISPSYSVFP